MKATATPLIALFEKKMRLEVPLFQRPYVWDSEKQWEPLWEDIERKFSEYIDGRTDAPVHFLGAIVLDQKQTPATHVERRMVIDGQQRLTTLQIFLVAFRDFCAASGVSALAEECQNFTLNKGMMPDPEVDKFKVWPTQLDRAPYRDVVEAGSPEGVKKKYPLVYRKYARRPDPRPRIVDCYLFFYDCISVFFRGSENDPPLGATVAIADRLETCFQALRNALLVVAIDLEQGDDAQVIFETLNARGEPLLPADLLRNYIFLRAARHNESQEALYSEFWAPFDEPFWREIVSQGRINRPRSDLFMQHYLASKQAIDIPIKHLYVEYRHWIERASPFAKVSDELRELSRGRDAFRRLLGAEQGYVYSSLATLLQIFDIGTAYPLLIFLLEDADENDLGDICIYLESYMLRRAVCGLTNKNYNRVFLTLTRNLRRDGISAASVYTYLNDLRGESAEWPADERFFTAWENNPIYSQLSSQRIVYILKRLDAIYRHAHMEDVEIRSVLSVEHILPQNWIENWPLASGERGLSYVELFDADDTDPRAVQTRARETLVQTIGNLTILSQGLNSGISNSAWSIKKPELLSKSLLALNVKLAEEEKWDEASILRRSRALFEAALRIWPRTVRE